MNSRHQINAPVSKRPMIDCHVMTGQWDYLLRVMVADLRDYERFVRNELQRIGGIGSIDTSFAYGTVKSRAAFPLIKQKTDSVS